MAENREREETQHAAPTGNGDAEIIPLGGQTQLGGRSWNLGNQGMLKAPGRGWMNPPMPGRSRKANPSASGAAERIDGNDRKQTDRSHPPDYIRRQKLEK